MIPVWALLSMAALAAAPARADELVFRPGADPRFHWESFEALKSQDLRGQTLTVMAPWLGPDKVLFESVLAYFEAATGIKVIYSGSSSFEQQIVIDAESGAPPDIAGIPQPGLAADLARKGYLRPLRPATADWLKVHYALGDTWAGYGTYPGPDGAARLYALPYKADVKSLVWYVPENFAQAGYNVPHSMEELKALTERIVADGGTPWCIGIASRGATGWPATDWVEDLMLRLYPPETYDDWVANRLRFDDPKVVAAVTEFGWFAGTDAHVAGGAQAVATTDFRDSVRGLFTVPPQCYLHHQGSFIPSFFPEGVQPGRDVDVFALPPYAARGPGVPVLGAATLFTRLTDNPASDAFIAFLQTPIAHEIWMAQEGFTTPYRDVNADVYANPVLRKMNDMLLQANSFRFDGSDLMPGAIGAGAFWTGMVDFVGGTSAEVVTSRIQATWDGVKK